MGERCVYKVTIADRPGNGGGTEVDLTAPVMLCDEFNAKYVTFFLSNDESVTATPAFNHHPNAFQVLMHANRGRSHLPSTIYLLCVRLYIRMCLYLLDKLWCFLLKHVAQLLFFFSRSVGPFLRRKSPSNNKLIWSGLTGTYRCMFATIKQNCFNCNHILKWLQTTCYLSNPLHVYTPTQTTSTCLF